jgi:adenosylcobyric acid synthase
MFVGTASESGKSVMAAAFCRILFRRGLKVAPFKAQNMALNSCVTRAGKEMGRAQVVQAEAAGIEPDVDMNPILLKPTSEKGSQVIIHGVVHGTMDASGYYAMKKQFWPRITESYERLCSAYDYIVLEGAGSPVEMNLKNNDIVNLAMAEYADARVVLVADIDRGGVFASIIGTAALLEEKEKQRFIGFIINKFRGDEALLRDGLLFIEEKTGLPALGLVPYIRDLYVPGEDSVSLERKHRARGRIDAAHIAVGIIRLPHISNYTDFDPLEADPRFSVDYISSSAGLHDYAAVILPGSKNVFADLRFLSKTGLAPALISYYQGGGKLVGMCGGYQMLGHSIEDPYGVEDRTGVIEGLKLLPIASVMEQSKVTAQGCGMFQLPGLDCSVPAEGYEIHMGRTSIITDQKFSFIRREDSHPQEVATADGRVWGTYLHGIFENDGFRDHFFTWVNNAQPVVPSGQFSYAAFKEENYDRLARVVEEHVNVSYILQKLGVE